MGSSWSVVILRPTSLLLAGEAVGKRKALIREDVYVKLTDNLRLVGAFLSEFKFKLRFKNVGRAAFQWDREEC